MKYALAGIIGCVLIVALVGVWTTVEPTQLQQENLQGDLGFWYRSPPLTEHVTCVFSDTRVCRSRRGTCEGTGECTVAVRGVEGTLIDWHIKGCTSEQSVIDGVAETIVFTCIESTPNTTNDTDPAPTPNASAGALWSVLLSTGELREYRFGEEGDVPVPGDYDGDGKTDLAVWRRYRDTDYRGQVSKWIIKRSSDGQVVEHNPWGTFHDYPAQADYDGDGKTDLAVARPSTNEWFIYLSGGGGFQQREFAPWPTDKFFETGVELGYLSNSPAPADYDGDGKADRAYFQPTNYVGPNAKWFIERSTDGQIEIREYGKASNTYPIHYDIAVPSDADGDGQIELATWRAPEAMWYREGGIPVAFGDTLDTPVTGDFDGDGKDDIGVFRRYPLLSFTPLAQNLTRGHNGYDYQTAVFRDDDGTIRMFWCGQSPTGKLDAVWYAQSNNPQGPFSTPRLIDDGGCDVTAIKLPAGASDRCEGPTYFLYYEGDNMIYTYHQNGSVSSWAPGPYGNKIIASYSCDAQTWTRIGPVIASSVTLPPEAYGTGHPNAMYLDGKVLMTYHNGTNGSLGTPWLAHSADGEHFIIDGKTGGGVGSRVKYLAERDIFIGVGTYEMTERFWFGKDLADLPGWILSNAYSIQGERNWAPKTRECSFGPSLLTDPHGIIHEEWTYMYTGEYDMDGGTCINNGGFFPIGDAEISVTKVSFPRS